MKEIEEHDIVIVGKKAGTVVHIHNENNYVVEFLKEDGSSLLETINKSQIVMNLGNEG
jgi:hypothetical protein